MKWSDISTQIQTFNLPVEASSCAVSSYNGRVYFAGDDSKIAYGFKTEESNIPPTITTFFEAADDVTGMVVYAGLKSDYLFVAQTDLVAVYTGRFRLVGTMKISGAEDIEIQGLAVVQAKTTLYPAGALTYAIEDEDGKAFGVSSLESALKALKIDANTAYDPSITCVDCAETICTDCSSNGFCDKRRSGTTCSCFAGFAGTTCHDFTCKDNCSGNGECVGANECKCESGWGGLHCSFLLVEPKLETDANGGDGDDPAIWISPISPDQSRIVTTTKSEQGAGLGVFDLSGHLLQTLVAGEPNNVDMIYNFTLGSGRTVDLAFAACREDNTLCLFKMSSNGTLSYIDGGVQPVVSKNLPVFTDFTDSNSGCGLRSLWILLLPFAQNRSSISIRQQQNSRIPPILPNIELKWYSHHDPCTTISLRLWWPSRRLRRRRSQQLHLYRRRASRSLALRRGTYRARIRRIQSCISSYLSRPQTRRFVLRRRRRNSHTRKDTIRGLHYGQLSRCVSVQCVRASTAA